MSVLLLQRLHSDAGGQRDHRARSAARHNVPRHDRARGAAWIKQLPHIRTAIVLTASQSLGRQRCLRLQIIWVHSAARTGKHGRCTEPAKNGPEPTKDDAADEARNRAKNTRGEGKEKRAPTQHFRIKASACSTHAIFVTFRNTHTSKSAHASNPDERHLRAPGRIARLPSGCPTARTKSSPDHSGKSIRVQRSVGSRHHSLESAVKRHRPASETGGTAQSPRPSEPDRPAPAWPAPRGRPADHR